MNMQSDKTREKKCCEKCDCSYGTMLSCKDQYCECHTPPNKTLESLILRFREMFVECQSCREGVSEVARDHIEQFVTEAWEAGRLQPYAHDSAEEYCCACDYDIVELRGRVEVARQEGFQSAIERVRESLEKTMDANDDGMWTGRESYEEVLQSLTILQANTDK